MVLRSLQTCVLPFSVLFASRQQHGPRLTIASAAFPLHFTYRAIIRGTHGPSRGRCVGRIAEVVQNKAHHGWPAVDSDVEGAGHDEGLLWNKVGGREQKTWIVGGMS